MIDKWREDCGDEDAEEFAKNWCTKDDLKIGYLHLVSKEMRETHEFSDWYVSGKEPSKFEVWVYWA